MINITSHNATEYKKAIDYVKWLDTHMGYKPSPFDTGTINIHYKFNKGRYSQLLYYGIAGSKEIFFYTPHEYKLVGTSHTLNDTYSFFTRLLSGEFSTEY